MYIYIYNADLPHRDKIIQKTKFTDNGANHPPGGVTKGTSRDDSHMDVPSTSTGAATSVHSSSSSNSATSENRRKCKLMFYTLCCKFSSSCSYLDSICWVSPIMGQCKQVILSYEK
jgi:hypothetical protein